MHNEYDNETGRIGRGDNDRKKITCQIRKGTRKRHASRNAKEKERTRERGRGETAGIGERESSTHLRVKWTVDKINRDGKEISSRRARAA